MKENMSFTEGKIMQPLLLFAVPVLLALFLQAMYGAVDLLIVGKFASSADVSALSTGSQIMTTLRQIWSAALQWERQFCLDNRSEVVRKKKVAAVCLLLSLIT